MKIRRLASFIGRLSDGPSKAEQRLELNIFAGSRKEGWGSIAPLPIDRFLGFIDTFTEA